MAILHPSGPKECHEQALGAGFMCLYVCQEVHTRLWLSNVQHTLDLRMEEGGLYVPCLQASAGATPHPTSYCTREKSRKKNQGNQDGSLLPSYRRKGSCGEHFSSGCRGASHSSAATGQILSLLQGEERRPSLVLSLGRNPGLQIRGSIWQLAVGPTRGLCPK